MNLEFRRFQREYYPEYVSWFVDPELNRHLGPMGEDWLEAVLSEPEAEGVTWAVFRDDQMIAVIETFFDPSDSLSAIITGLATKPDLRRAGIGTTVLRMILARHRRKGIVKHVVYISINNPAGRRCAEKAGFVPIKVEPDEHGYIWLWHSQ
jgi:RimJ/RimL family protein N-acetyltransferase